MITIPQEYKKFVNSVKRRCKYHGIDLVLSPSKQVVLDTDYQNECSGWFDGGSKTFVVACGKPAKDWVEVMVHESCHMDQWIRDKRYDEWGEACATFWDYLSGIKILNKAQVAKVVDKMVELELDCEQRAVEKIIKWELPIDIHNYIREANIYVFSYILMPEYKRFPSGLTLDRQLVESAPDEFLEDYSIIPENIETELHRFYQGLIAKAA